MSDMDKIYIFHSQETDYENFPCGFYYIDKKTKQLYVSPVDKDETANAGETPAGSHIVISLSVVISIIFGSQIGAAIVSNSHFENSLLLLGIIAMFFTLFAYIRKKESAKQQRLVEKTGYQPVVCGEKEEQIFWSGVMKGHRITPILYLSSFALTVIFGYFVIAFSHRMPLELYIIPLIAFVVPAAAFAVLLVSLKDILGGKATVKSRLNLLKKEKYGECP